MCFTLESDYAVRITGYLAEKAVSGGERSEAKVISENTGVSLRFALKILRKLVTSGIVRSYKGMQGGYELGRKPSEITLLDVVRAIEGDYHINRCHEHDFICTRNAKSCCVYRSVFEEITDIVSEKLAEYDFEYLTERIGSIRTAPLVKICGLRTAADVRAVNEARPDFAGFVMFYEKSRRNISVETAERLIDELSPDIKAVAVTVSPDREQIEQIERAGFDYIQIHGTVDDAETDSTTIDIIKAFNISDIGEFERWSGRNRVKGFVFDSAVPGSGQTYDYSVLKDLPKVPAGKFVLAAGGINSLNAVAALKAYPFDGVDTSSGVEDEQGVKSPAKIEEFVRTVRSALR
ncbi:MAG: Rrf2 family transcriptional regulator [Oscillospiraceae bacterium]|nr:Rrf2 family transcriptional regulator [Oscillospiraceae bacterium]